MSSAELELFKKPRCVFTKGAARAVLMCKGPPDVEWLEREVAHLCRENCWPMSLVSNDFMAQLGRLFEAKRALEVLEDLRRRYEASHPFTVAKDTDLEALAAGID